MSLTPGWFDATFPSCLVLVLLASCGSNSLEGDPPHTGGSTNEGPSASLPPPSTRWCSLELDCASTVRDEPKVDCGLRVLERSGVTYQSRAGVELRGRSSLAYDKPNYSVELRTETGANYPVDLMGMSKTKTGSCTRSSTSCRHLNVLGPAERGVEQPQRRPERRGFSLARPCERHRLDHHSRAQP